MSTWKEFDQNVITHSAAHHLMAIDDLVSQTGYARVSDVARRLSITRGSVSISLRPLKDAGLVEQDENKHLRLSRAGQSLVDAIKTKRHVLTRMLVDLLRVSPDQADIDACKLEHLVSNETARQVLSMLRFLDEDAGRAEQFLGAWRSYAAQCDQTPQTCPTCTDSCLAQSVRGGQAKAAPRDTPAKPPVREGQEKPPVREGQEKPAAREGQEKPAVREAPSRPAVREAQPKRSPT